LVKWDKSALKEWGSYLRVGIPGAMMLCFEWWAFEILAIFTGYMGVDALAAEVVIINIVSFIFMLPLGISFAASSLTGNFIGQRNIKLAKRYAYLAISFGVFTILGVLVFIIAFNDAIARLFTNDEPVIDVIK
jgi:MATE family multidrug resistance protein